MLCRWPTLNCKLFFQKATVAKEERNLDKRNINSVFKNRRPRQVDSHIGRETHGRHTYTVYTHTHAQTHSREISLYEPGEKTRSYGRHDAGEISKLEGVVPLSHPPPTRLRMTAKFFLFLRVGLLIPSFTNRCRTCH